MNTSPIKSDYPIQQTSDEIRKSLQSIGVNGMSIDIRYDLNSGMAFVGFVFKGKKYERRCTSQKNASRNLRGLFINIEHKAVDFRRGIEDFEQSMSAYRQLGQGEPGASHSPTEPDANEPATKADFAMLDISEAATADEIKKAFRHQMSAWHPDRFMHDAEMKTKAEKKTGEINVAYQRICKTRGI